MPEDEAFLYYISTLDNVKWVDWQLHDCLNSIDSIGVTCWNYCRAGGKTEKASVLASFFLVRGEQVYWYAATMKQLKAAQLYWSKNPYIKRFKISKLRDTINAIDGSQMEISVLTWNNASGPRASIAFFDEAAIMDKDDLAQARDVAAHVMRPRLLVISTPSLGSTFHQYVRQYGESKHDYLECPWKNHEYIKNSVLPGQEWLFRQNHLCSFESAEGAVFPSDLVIEKVGIFTDEYIKTMFLRKQILQGVDFGAGKGHNMCRIAIDDNYIYVLKEIKFRYLYDDSLLQDYCNMYPTEVEVGGANETLGVSLNNVSYLPFTGNRNGIPGTKQQRVNIVTKRKIVIDPVLTPNTLKEIREAVYSITKGGESRFETGHLDYLSAFIHAVREPIKNIPKVVERSTSIMPTYLHRSYEHNAYNGRLY